MAKISKISKTKHTNRERDLREAVDTLYAYRVQAEYNGQKTLARKYIKAIKELELMVLNIGLEQERHEQAVKEAPR